VRIREQHPATVVRATPRCLPRQGQARRRGKQRRWQSSVAMPTPRKRGGGVMRVSVRMPRGAISTVSNSWRWKASRLAGKRCPSRGDVGTGASVGSKRTKGASSPSDEGPTTERGAREASKAPAAQNPLDEKGNLWPRRSAAAGGERGGSFARGFSARAVQCHRPTSRRRKRRLGRGVARKRRSDVVVVFEARTFGVLASPGAVFRNGLSRLAALTMLPREGRRAAP